MNGEFNVSVIYCATYLTLSDAEDMLKSAPGSARAIIRADAPIGGGYVHLPVFLGYMDREPCDGVTVG